MIVNTGTHPKLLWPGVYSTGGQVYNAHPTEYTDLYEMHTSQKAWEELVQVTGHGLAAIVTEGAAGTYDGEAQGYVTRATHISYALGYKVTYNEQQDNLYSEVATRRAQSNAFSMNQTIENVAAFLYNNAFSTTYYTTGDGKAICATDHVNVHGGSFSNALSPSADLSEQALEDVCVQIMGMQNDRGLLISLMPVSLHVPRQEWFNANRILKSINQSGNSNNDINVLRATNAFPGGIKMNHFFTSAGAWFVRTNCPQGPMFFWRERPNLRQDNDFDTRNACAMSFMRFSVVVNDPRGLVGSNAR